MTGLETVLKDKIQRMLDTGKALGWIVILVVNVDIAVLNSLPHIVREQAGIHIALGGLRSKLHHHAGRSVGIHIGILTCNVVSLGVDDFLEDFVALGIAGKASPIPVSNVLFGHFLPWALHKLHLHTVLDLLHGHHFPLILGDGISNLCCEDDILPVISHRHGLENSGYNLLVVELDNTPIAFLYLFYHIRECL